MNVGTSNTPKISMRLDNIARFLSGLSIFREIDKGKLADVAARSRERTYRDGQFLLHEGDRGEHLLVLCEGSANMTFSSQGGREFIFRRAFPGDILGAVSLVDGGRRSASGYAVGETRALCLHKKDVQELLGTPAFSRDILLLLCEQVRFALSVTEMVTVYDLESRLARLLVYLGKAHGRECTDGILIRHTFPQHQLGMMVNASRPKVNIKLRKLQSDGLIRMQQSRILIVDSERLIDRAQISRD